MPRKHPNTERWGGPGASHEDRTKPMPPKVDPRAPGAPSNTPISQVTGGGGERHPQHGHGGRAKRGTEENSAERRKP
jgi:hypothetical protein